MCLSLWSEILRTYCSVLEKEWSTGLSKAIFSSLKLIMFRSNWTADGIKIMQHKKKNKKIKEKKKKKRENKITNKFDTQNLLFDGTEQASSFTV